jgi:beta-fructofuranosidase/levanase
MFRPFYHYSPAKYWMNDPNGLVFYNNKYHLFYQYNPNGMQPDNISWGHAVSTDLINWVEKPLAIPAQNGVMAYSGSVVVDWNNTSGFGVGGKPPLVAIYTGASNVQDQRIAYSNDEGETWINYSQNPVINSNNNNNFRDPKVFWHQETQKWIMAVSIPDYRNILFYSSSNLKNWNFQQYFEGAANISSLWECPDLFELPVDNNPSNKKWVLTHSVAPTAQYFIGDFTGQNFNWSNIMPSGILIEDFEKTNYSGWTVTGDAFGTTPSGTAVAAGYLGERFCSSFVGGNDSQGKLISSDFIIQKKYISFLIGGGYNPDHTYIKLVINGQKVRTSTGMNEDIMKWRNWDVSSLIGQTAHIEIVDSATLAWGHVNVDHIIQSDVINDNVDNGQVDYGADFYALRSFSDMPDGRRIWIAWLNNWVYATGIPTSPWKGIMSIPREINLETHNGQVKLVQKPVEELKILRKDTVAYKNTDLDIINNAITNTKYKQFEIEGRVAVENKEGFTLVFKKNGQQYTQFVFDFLNKNILFDRSRSGVTINSFFAQLQVAPLITENGYFDFHLFVDNSSVELFSAGGQVVMSNQIFPDSTSNKIELRAIGQKISFQEFNIWNFENKSVLLPPPPPSTPVTYLLFRSYPNPIVNDDHLTIQLNNDMVGKVKFKLFNASGMLIYEFQPQNNSVNIPLGTIVKSKGIYFLKASSGTTTQTKRLLIIK